MSILPRRRQWRVRLAIIRASILSKTAILCFMSPASRIVAMPSILPLSWGCLLWKTVTLPRGHRTRIFLSPIRHALQPEITDMYMPPEGVAHNIVLFDIADRYAGNAFKTACSMWGAGQMMFNKFMMILTRGAKGSLHDPATIAPMLAGVDPEYDLLVSRGPLDVLDHSSSRFGFGAKMASRCRPCTASR